MAMRCGDASEPRFPPIREGLCCFVIIPKGHGHLFRVVLGPS
jgi:hypothetical protein